MLPPRTISDNADANGSQTKPLPSLQTHPHGLTRMKGRLGPEDIKRPDSDRAEGHYRSRSLRHNSHRPPVLQLHTKPRLVTRIEDSESLKWDPTNAVHSLPLLYGPGQEPGRRPRGQAADREVRSTQRGEGQLTRISHKSHQVLTRCKLVKPAAAPHGTNLVTTNSGHPE